MIKVETITESYKDETIFFNRKIRAPDGITESTYKYTTYILCTKYRILFFPQITTLS